MPSIAKRVLVAAAALLLCGCRGSPIPPPESFPATPKPGAQVDFVRQVMIDAAEDSEGPERSEKAVEAVRVWRGEGGED